MMMDTMLMKMRSNGEADDDMFTWLRKRLREGLQSSERNAKCVILFVFLQPPALIVLVKK